MEYIFYDRDGKELFYDIDKPFDCGSYGQVYKLNEKECLKWFLDNEDDDVIDDMDVFYELISLDIDNFYKIYKLLYSDIGTVEGYVMKYYSKDIDDILGMDMDYMLDSFNRLYETIKIISDKGINMCDMHPKNFILNKDGIVIIDADNYFRDKGYFLLNSNKKRLYNAFSELLGSILDKYYKKDLGWRKNRECFNEIYRLFSIDNSPSIINSKVRSYKRPIDYLYSRNPR